MLPRTACAGISNLDRFFLAEGRDAIRDDPVPGSIAAADYISRTSAGDLHRVILEKTIAVRSDDQFRNRFAGAVRVASSEPVFFAGTRGAIRDFRSICPL